MARATFFNKLPEDIQNEVNRRLRVSSYGNQNELLEWLLEQGYHATKSALSRYAVALKRSDGFENKSAHDIAAESSGHAGLSRADSILIELGRMKIREMELLREWNELRDD